MRSPTDAIPLPWPSRIFRPWAIASASGLILGFLLLTFVPEPPTDQNSYAETAPRAAFHDPRGDSFLSSDPFAPAASLAAPPEAPAKTNADDSGATTAAAPGSVETP